MATANLRTVAHMVRAAKKEVSSLLLEVCRLQRSEVWPKDPYVG